ncbi:RDD family protein [Herpetosiphon llansteffanensis]|uniref:RDD family protein n=1 Tax=Herpetosiphon llansteffanensis TaxID=2094568 RepID=UPI0013DEF7B8|nr:RDD family protein [Herpetosiphon llansteffanensis]
MIDNRMNDRYIIDTPESIEFGYDVAGIGARFVAALIDTALFSIILFIAFRLYIGDMRMILFVSPMAIRIFFAFSIFTVLIYYIAFERFWNGQTPGKRLLGIRVVQEAGKPLTFSGSLIRNLLRLIDFVPAYYSLGLLTMLIDKRARRLGDLAASTFVVRDRQRVTLEMLLQSTRNDKVASALKDSGATLPNITALRPVDMDLVQNFLLRRGTLAPDRRLRIATQLAYALFGRLGYSVPGDPEQFLQQANDQYVLVRAQALQQSTPAPVAANSYDAHRG